MKSSAKDVIICYGTLFTHAVVLWLLFQ